MKLVAFGKAALEWRQLSWLPGYEISEFGDLRRTAKTRTKPMGAILKGTVNPAGYKTYNLGTGIGGRGKRLPAHKAVCEAWHGPRPPDKNGVAHADGNPLNNHYSNLRWATQAENMADRRAHGNYKFGEDAPHVKLTWAIVDEIRNSYAGKKGEQAAIARRFDLSQTHVSAILKGEIWRREIEA